MGEGGGAQEKKIVLFPSGSRIRRVGEGGLSNVAMVLEDTYNTS